jgi:toxin ParE1/3/4
MDMLDIHRYIVRSGSPLNANHLLDHFEEVIGSLSEMPERGHYPPELERLGIYQYLEIHLKVYRIIYQIIGPDVFVHAVLDGRRDIPELLYQRLIRQG